jgi:hypothetical protein
MISLRALQRFRLRTRRSGTADRCELCSVDLGEQHPHAVDLEKRTLTCLCKACSLLFAGRNDRVRYRTIADRVLIDRELDFSEQDWIDLDIPVRLAFLFFNSQIQRWVAVYPSPAGPTEAVLETERFQRLAARSTIFSSIEPDIEAFIAYARRPHERTTECYLVPIDVCYDLVGRVRRGWRGFNGGDDIRREIEGIFGRLRDRSRPFVKRSEPKGE